MPPFTPKDIARHEATRNARQLSIAADEVRPFAGGVMGRAGPGVWTNRTGGVGFNTPVTDADVQTLIDFFAETGAEPRVDLCPYTHPSLVQALARAGFGLRNLYSCFALDLDPARPVLPAVPHTPKLTLRTVNPADDAEVLAFARCNVAAFLPEGREPPEPFMRPAIRTIRHGQTTGAAAWLDGQIVGAGFVDASGPIASLFGVGVDRAYRNRGIQQALLAFRLNESARRGCQLATIAGDADGPTERNALRMGFRPVFSRALLTRPGPGLRTLGL